MHSAVPFAFAILAIVVVPGEMQYYPQAPYHYRPTICPYPRPVTAVSLIRPNAVPTKGANTKVKGVVKISQGATGGSSMISIQLEGLKPNTEHGIHVHEFGDIVTKGCASAGAHYNPYGQTHGGPKDCIRHVGDLGNVKSDAKGKVTVKISDPMVSIVGATSVIGRTIVVHANIDDLGKGTGKAFKESKITGNAGARLSCGVIVHAKP